MKRLALIGFLFFCCQPAHAAGALVQRSTGTFSATTTCTCTVKAIGSGNLLVYGLASAITGNPSSVKSTNNTLVLVSSSLITGSASGYIYQLANSVSGDTAITGTTASSSGDCACWEFSGMATSAALDVKQKTDNGASATSENGSAVTPTNTGDACVATNVPHASVTGITSWTGSFPANGNGFAFRFPASISALTPVWTGDTAGGSYCANTACFLPAAGGAAVSGFDKRARLQRYD